MIADEFVIKELTGGDRATAVELCRVALDLPEDAAEAEAIVTRLLAGLNGGRPDGDGSDDDGSNRGRRTVGFLAWPAKGGQGEDGPLGVVLGSLDAEDRKLGHLDLIAVRPEVRRKGVGRALTGAAENALAEMGGQAVALAGNPPYYAWPGIDVRYTPAVCMALALGYELDTTAWNMTADLAEGSPAVRDTGPAEARLASAGVLVRRAVGADRAALTAFARDNFESPSWAGEVADSLDRPGAGCHIALRDGELLGFAAYGSSRPSWFGPMGTAPAAQGLGIGAVLLRRCLIDQRADGHRSAQIGWVGPVPFYSAVAGARIERVFFLYRKVL